MVNRTKSKAKERIRRVMDSIPSLKQESFDSPMFRGWRRDVEVAIAYTFGSSTRHGRDFAKIRFTPNVNRQDGRRITIRRNAYNKGLVEASVILASMMKEIDEYWVDQEQVAKTLQGSQHSTLSGSKRVFIVHGRDLGTRDMVARFLEVLELETVILQEQPNQGITIIEKFERHAQVGFAVVLFTPDDIGSVRDDMATSHFRARQNVIFELGYLISHLGRERVAVLYKGDEGEIEIPSDYSGILYTQMDDGGGWRFELIREMQSAGLDVDANKAM